MVETMRKQNKEQEEFKRVHEDLKRKSVKAREMMEELIRV